MLLFNPCIHRLQDKFLKLTTEHVVMLKKILWLEQEASFIKWLVLCTNK